jgi:hypothetical protein
LRAKDKQTVTGGVLGEDDKFVGMEILDASQHANLDKLLPVKYEVPQKSGW